MSALRREGGWAVADQVLSSGTNFIPAVVLARLLGPSSYGAFSLAFVAWFGALAIIKSGVMQPFTLAAADAAPAQWRAITRRAAGAALLSSFVCSAGFCLASVLAGGDFGRALLVLAVLAPGLTLQEFWRAAAFSSSRARSAAVNDACWAITQIVAFLVLTSIDRPVTVATSLLAWGGGAVVAAAVGVGQFRVIPSLAADSVLWLRSVARVSAWFVSATVVFSIGVQGIAIFVAYQTGSGGLGLLRAGQNLFGPVQLIIVGLEAVYLPYAVRQGRTSAPLRNRARYSLLLGASVALYATVVLVAGRSILGAFFGDLFLPASALIAPIAVSLVLDACGLGAAVQLRATAQGARLFATQSAATVARLASVAIFASVSGVRGAAWGLAVGSAVSCTLWWLQAMRAVRSEEPRLNRHHPTDTLVSARLVTENAR